MLTDANGRKIVVLGDTVTLAFAGPGGQKSTEKHKITKGDFWSGLLLNKSQGDKVTLPEKGGDEVYGLIKSIRRARRRK